MQTYGGNVVASPSEETVTGRRIRAEFPDTPGSLGIAISEALEDASSRDDTNYALGSVLNHVVLHQSIIGLEAKKQMEIAGEYPDVIVGCCGGGSNFAGQSACSCLNKSAPRIPRTQRPTIQPIPKASEPLHRTDTEEADASSPS